VESGKRTCLGALAPRSSAMSAMATSRFQADVLLVEHTIAGSSTFLLPARQLLAAIERCLLEGVRPDERTRREWRVVEPRLDEKTLEPMHRVLPAAPRIAAARPASLGYEGVAKASHSGGCEGPTPGQYGEDAAAASAISSSRPGFVVDWLFEADGHGGRGSCTAAYARRLFQEKWTELASEICDLTDSGCFQQAIDMMQRKCYDKVLSAVEADAEQKGWTGSTVTQMLTVTTPAGRRIVYTSNMGDSPSAIMVIGGARASKGPKVFSTYSLHSWEDKDEMCRYVKSVWAAREKARLAGDQYVHIKPQAVGYHTFNLHESGALLEDLHGNAPFYDPAARRWVRGRARPIEMWLYHEMRDESGSLTGWEVELDPMAEEHVWRAAVKAYGVEVLGGVQAIAGKEILVCGPEATPIRPVAPTNRNWGSSVLLGSASTCGGGRRRGCQATRAIADTDERRRCYTSDQASWMAVELLPDEEVIQVVMSDGVGDVVGLQELAEHLSAYVQRSKGHRDGRLIAAEMLRIALSRASCRRDGEHELRPCHDDCSVAVAYRLPNMQRAWPVSVGGG